MVRKDKHTLKSGIVKTQIRVVEGYRDSEGKIKQRTIKNFGYLEEQNDPIAFMKEVVNFDNKFKESKKIKNKSFKNKFYEDDNNTLYNYGYRFLEAIYDSLELESFFKQFKFNCKYDLNEIFKFLTIQRILNPDSKRATTQLIEALYNQDYNFQLYDIYRALDKFDEVKIQLQKHISDKAKSLIGRDTSYAYYDVTNYFCHIDFPNGVDDLRQRGVSKEHRVDPIIQLGLFLDSNGIPISMSLFKGNTSDTLTLQPVMKEIKRNYNLNRLIVVADKGLNSSSNINYICNNYDGYVISQIIKGKKGKRYHERLFSEDNYMYNADRTFKYQLFTEEYEGLDRDGNKCMRKRNVLIYWKYEQAVLEAKKRDDKLARAIKSLGNNAYAIKHTYEQYIKELHIINQTGEVADKVNRQIDEEKVTEDAKYDGYSCIITSELDYDYQKILEVYGGLWRIEETFRITKSDLELRPIYVRTNEHINGHFIICFVSLVIIRLLQYRMNYSLSVERIVRALNTSKCLVEEDDTIKIIKNEHYKEYNKDPDKNKLLFNNNSETIEDIIKIIEYFKADIPYAKYRKKDFIKYLTSIQY